MNNDLISRSELRKEFKKCPVFTEVYLHYARQLIDNAPAVDIEPFVSVTFDKDELNRIVDERVIDPIKNGELVVKTEERQHGEWIDEGQYAEGHSEHYYRCSECGGHIIELRVDDFCKHCGADMRKETEK